MLSKKEFLDTPPKKRKFWLITEKLFLGYFCGFYIFFVFLFLLSFWFSFFFCFFVEGLRARWGGPKGHLTWPPKPSSFLFCFVLVFFGPPHLALNTPYFFCFFSFPFFASNRQKNLLSLSLFLPSLFWPPPFSMSLSLSLSCYFLFSFLSFFFALFSFLVFLSFFSFFFAFVSWKEQHQNIELQLFFTNLFSFLGGFLSCFSFESLYLIFVFFFPDFKLCFLFNINVFGFKKSKLKNTNFWSKGGLQQNGFFMSLCLVQNVKSYRSFCPVFFCQFWLMFEKHYENRYFSAFFKEKAKIPFEVLLSGPSSGPSWLQLKNGQLGPDNNTSNLRAQVFFKKKVFLTNSAL